MLINITYLINKYNLKINGILHIGAHLCEEKQVYDENNINNVLWIEGNTNIVNKVKKLIYLDNETGLQYEFQ